MGLGKEYIMRRYGMDEKMYMATIEASEVSDFMLVMKRAGRIDAVRAKKYERRRELDLARKKLEQEEVRRHPWTDIKGVKWRE